MPPLCSAITHIALREARVTPARNVSHNRRKETCLAAHHRSLGLASLSPRAAKKRRASSTAVTQTHPIASATSASLLLASLLAMTVAAYSRAEKSSMPRAGLLIACSKLSFAASPWPVQAAARSSPASPCRCAAFDVGAFSPAVGGFEFGAVALVPDVGDARTHGERFTLLDINSPDS